MRWIAPCAKASRPGQWPAVSESKSSSGCNRRKIMPRSVCINLFRMHIHSAYKCFSECIRVHFCKWIGPTYMTAQPGSVKWLFFQQAQPPGTVEKCMHGCERPGRPRHYLPVAPLRPLLESRRSDAHSCSWFRYHTFYPKSHGKNLWPLNTIGCKHKILSYLCFFVYHLLINIFEVYDRAFCQCIYCLFLFSVNLSFFEGATFSKGMANDSSTKA